MHYLTIHLRLEADGLAKSTLSATTSYLSAGAVSPVLEYQYCTLEVVRS